MSIPHQSFLIAFAAALAGGSGAMAETGAPAFPAGADAGRVLPWLAANTSVKPADIVVVGPQAVVSLDSLTAFPGKTAAAVAVVREEIIDQGYADRRQARSARLEVELDCTAGAYRIRRLSRFALPDLKGVEMEAAAPLDWAHAPDGSAMGRILHTACARAAALQSRAAPATPALRATLAPRPVPIAVSAPASAPAALTPAVSIAAVDPQALPAAPVEGPSPPPAAPTAPARAAMPFKVQLGSYSTAQNALRAGVELRRGFPKPVIDREVVVDQASSNGRGYFLLLVQGFAARADAAAFCKAVSASPSQCLIRR